jgi:hypothetical protein
MKYVIVKHHELAGGSRRLTVILNRVETDSDPSRAMTSSKKADSIYDVPVP